MAKRSTGNKGAPASQKRPVDRTRLARLILVAATIAAYSNTLRCPFVFDDKIDIVENQSIRHLWPPWRPMFVTSGGKTALHGRPVVTLSLAVNYAMGGLNPLPYHLTNLGIHVLAGLTLFGIARRTLASPALAPRYGEFAMPLALTIAALWALHPLQTQAVTYTVQRYESLMGMLYLLSFYCAIRSASSPHPRRWEVACVATCFLALESKEVAVSIPIVILLYDRAFLAGSFREAWRRRHGMYLGLAATWVAFLGLFAISASRGQWAGYGLTVSATEYALSQFGVILHYLRLSFWPFPQVLDYDWPVATTVGEIVPGLLVILTLVAATVWALVRRPAWGLLGAWFFLILAPTSSIMPIADLAFEHRMYLPLAAVAAATVIGAYEAIQWWCKRQSVPPDKRLWALALPALAAACGLCLACHARNQVYQNDISVWRDTVDKVPNNSRAHNNLGAALGDQGLFEDSLVEFRTALKLAPRYGTAYYNLGKTLTQLGRNDEAIGYLETALEMITEGGNRERAAAQSQLAFAFYNLNKIEDAVRHFRRALELDPDTPAAYYNLANALSRQGKVDEAIARYEEALQLDPRYAAAHTNLANVLYKQGELDEAAVHYQKALAINPRQKESHCSLGAILIEQGKLDEAMSHCHEAVRIDPEFAEAFHNLGRALWLKGQYGEAVTAWREAARLRPKRTAQLRQLAWALATCPDKSARNGAEALGLVQRAMASSGESADLLDVLAAVQAENGGFAQAVETAQKAAKLASERGDAALADTIRTRIALYQSGSAFRDTEAPRGASQTRP